MKDDEIGMRFIRNCVEFEQTNKNKKSKCNLASRIMSRESRGGHVTDSRQ